MTIGTTSKHSDAFGHMMHAVEPTAVLKLPIGQKLHAEEPALGANRPAAHGV